jgi:hypothetical protein
MIEPSQQRIAEPKEDAAEQAKQTNEPLREAAPINAVEGDVRLSETLNRHAEAGRKGARRIHELIRQGRLYEQEHGLKPGRQRLRQLIQEGKLYEHEHGLRNGGLRARERRRPRLSSEQLLKTLFQTLLRLAKPAHRSRIISAIQALDAEVKQG